MVYVHPPMGGQSRRRTIPPGPLIRQIQDLDEPEVKVELVRRVHGARLVFCDHELLMHDFPELREAEILARSPELRALSPEARGAKVRKIIEEWVLWNAAFTSQTQADQTRANTPIPITGSPVLAWRPPRYGRAFVVQPMNLDRSGPSPGGCLFDLKGAGAVPGAQPFIGPHASGLCSLYRLISDTCFQWIFDEIFARASPTFSTLPMYALLDLGFDLLESPPAPAGLQVRRAHRRPPSAIELPPTGSGEEAIKLQIELLLRRFGLTSCTWGSSVHLQDDGHGVQVNFGPMPVALSPVERAEVASAFRLGATPLRLDGINIQLTREVSYRPPSAQVLDFGHYHARDWFHFPLASQVRDQAIRVGGIVWPDSEHFVQPDPRVRLPSAVYGYDEMSAWAMQLASSFRRGELSGDELRECIYERLPRWPAPVSGAVGRARI